MIRGSSVLEQLTGLAGQGPHEAVAVYSASRNGLTRYAGSRIHQNLERREATVTFRVALESRIGVARTSDLSLIGLEACLERALVIARLQKPNRWWNGLSAGPNPVGGGDEVTEGEIPTPAWRLDQAHTTLQQVGRAGLQAAGSVTTAGGELAVVNSEGRMTREPFRLSEAVLVAMDGEGASGASGYAVWAGSDPAALDTGALAAVAAEKCIMGRERVAFEPGPVDVLLEPPAVAGLLDWLGYIGFGGKSFNDGTSFLCRRLGERIMGDAVSIYDDHAEVPGMGLARDFEGEPRQRVDLVRDGVATGVVHDRLSATRAATATTGHALSADTEMGPMPLNMAMAPGANSRESMLTSMERGLVVTRFHYLNGLLDTRRALFTGMTRDGTFLIEDGKLTSGLTNFRFHQNVLAAMANCTGMSSELTYQGTFWGAGSLVPESMRIKDFNFSGKTDF